MVWPTARVRLTARSKSISPESTSPISVDSACDVGAGEGDRGAVLGEAERPPEPARLLEVDAGLGGDLDRGEDRRLAEDVLLEVLAGRPSGRG